MLYVFTKKQALVFAALGRDWAKRVLSLAAAPQTIESCNGAIEARLIESGLFTYRNNVFVPMIRIMSALEVAADTAPPPAKVKPKPLADPAAALVEEFCRRYRKCVGAPYVASAADRSVARKLAQDLRGVSVSDVIKTYVRHRFRFYPKDGTASIKLMAHSINELIVAASRPKSCGKPRKDEVDDQW